MGRTTPPPWFLVGTLTTRESTIISTKPVINGVIDLDGEVLGHSEWLRAEEDDLRLMAAAPELLAALVDCVASLGVYEIGESTDVARANAAIAKATGSIREEGGEG